MSKSAYAAMANLKEKYKAKDARRTLKNISGGKEYLCKKIWLFTKQNSQT
jgi:hypothetical protein